MIRKKMWHHGMLLSLSLTVCGWAPAVHAATPEHPATVTIAALKEGKEYTTLPQALNAQPPVVEFFSFYCGPCYQFVDKYPVSTAINRTLPEGEVTKYHVSLMGKLGNELTEAWAIAIVTGKTDQLERPLFEAVQRMEINNIKDIKSIFAQVGVNEEMYDNLQRSIVVKNKVAEQNAALKAFNVTGTPSFYINGKYRINNAGISATSPESYVDNFANTVKILLAQ